MKEVRDEAVVTIELDVRERRLYDRLRARVVPSAPNAPSGIGDLLLLLPDLVVLLFRLMRDERVPVGSKAIAMLAAGYLVSPIDLVPDLVLGPIGLIDDLLVVGSALSRMVNHVHPDVVRSHWSGHGDALDAIQRVSGWVEVQVGQRLRALWRRVAPV